MRKFSKDPDVISRLSPEQYRVTQQNESREMLGVMPPQASPQSQCPCPDTSA